MSEGRHMKYLMHLVDNYADAAKKGAKEKDLMFFRNKIERSLKPVVSAHELLKKIDNEVKE